MKGVGYVEEASLQSDFMRVASRFTRLHLVDIFTDVSKGEFFLLQILHQHRKGCADSQGMYVSELAAEMRMATPGVSRMLKSLEAKGYIERHVDEKDRRNTYICITQAGEDVRTGLMRHMSQLMDRVFEKMGYDEVRQLIALWNRLLEAMHEELKNYGKGA